MDHYRQPFITPVQTGARRCRGRATSRSTDGPPTSSRWSRTAAGGSPRPMCPSRSSMPNRARSSAGRIRELVRTWPNPTETTVSGTHFIREDSPDEIGTAVAEFVRKLRPKQAGALHNQHGASHENCRSAIHLRTFSMTAGFIATRRQRRRRAALPAIRLTDGPFRRWRAAAMTTSHSPSTSGYRWGRRRG
jgi:hypothetical protein